MTLKTLKELLTPAQRHHYAVGAFNASNMEFVQSIIAAGERLASPLIISTTQGAIEYAGMDTLCDIIIPAAKRSLIPIAFHLDHGTDMTIIKQALRSGYTSIMYDGSHLPFDENVKNPARLVRMAHDRGVSVEAELGTIGGAEDAVRSRHITLTRAEDAREFVQRTRADALAIAIGTSHGAYKFSGRSTLDIARLRDIRNAVNIPLVLHGASEVPHYLSTMAIRYGAKIPGASGVLDSNIRVAVKNGICKVNEDTDLRLAWLASVRKTLAKKPAEFDPRKILGPARDYVQNIIEDRIKLLGSAGRAVHSKKSHRRNK